MKQLNKILLVVCPFAFKQLLFSGCHVTRLHLVFHKIQDVRNVFFYVVLFCFVLFSPSSELPKCMHSHTQIYTFYTHIQTTAEANVLLICVYVYSLNEIACLCSKQLLPHCEGAAMLLSAHSPPLFPLATFHTHTHTFSPVSVFFSYFFLFAVLFFMTEKESKAG